MIHLVRERQLDHGGTDEQVWLWENAVPSFHCPPELVCCLKIFFTGEPVAKNLSLGLEYLLVGEGWRCWYLVFVGELGGKQVQALIQ